MSRRGLPLSTAPWAPSSLLFLRRLAALHAALAVVGVGWLRQVHVRQRHPMSLPPLIHRAAHHWLEHTLPANVPVVTPVTVT